MPDSLPRRRKTEPPARADELAKVVLQRHDGVALRLGDLWLERAVALVWLRHYG
jgi:hypothetical protein